MRTLTILLNLGQLAFMAFLLMEKGIPSVDQDDFWIFLLLILVPSITIITFARNRSDIGNHKTLLGLYLQRRRLEEEKRISQLNG